MKKVLETIMLVTLTISMLAGCGKKEVDYSLTDGTEAGTENVAGTEDGTVASDSLESFRNLDTWEADWKVTDTSGKEQNIKVKAEIVVPETLKSMRVIQYKPLGRELVFKKQCLEEFFGADTEYYYHDEEDYTREEVERWRPDDTELLQDAPEERVIAEEFESQTDYAAYRDDILYEIYLADDTVTIYSNWDDENKCGPEEFRNYKNVSTSGEFQTNEENQCKYSMEEAQEIAEDFLKEIGLNSMECTMNEPMVWCGNNSDDLEDESADEYATYGYVFSYGTGIDGVSFVDEFPSSTNFTTNYESLEAQGGYACVWSGDPAYVDKNGSAGHGYAFITVTDAGINSVHIDSAEVIEDTSNAVELLPLEQIQKILKEEVVKRTAIYDILDYNEYNSLQLMYLKIKEDSEDSLSAIPVWCFAWESDGSYDHPVFVNAMSGNVIHFADAEWAGLDLTAADTQDTQE